MQAAAAFVLYLAVSLILYALPVWGRFSRVFVGDGRGDSKLYVWALRWWPYAVEHGLNPLHPNIIWAHRGSTWLGSPASRARRS